MEALLREAGEGLALGSGGSDGPQCRSAGELKNKIGQLFGGKVSETRAERVSASFEIPADVMLDLSEVSLDVVPSGPDLAAIQASTATRKFYTVREVVVSQPDADKDPLAQKAVAAFLMIYVRQADGSVWGVQSTSRATQGWTVSYVCQHSMACWKQGSTTQKKHIVGLSTTNDMIHHGSLARPAFDCRGVVNITFSRFSRSVVIKYDHTNFHRSVADLAKLFPPPQPPSPLLLPGMIPGSTNKRPKEGQAEGPTPKRKRPRKSAAAPEGGQVAENGDVPTAALTEAAEPSASGPTPKRKRPRKSAAAATGEEATAEGAVEVSGPVEQDGTPGAATAKPKKPRRSYVRKSKIAAAAGADGTATAGETSTTQAPTSIAAAAVDVMMDLGIDVNMSGDLSEVQVAEALLQHLHESPEDNTGSAAALMDALAENVSASEANWQLSRESAAAATELPEPAAPTTAQTFSNDQAAAATAPLPQGNTAEQPRPYMLVTEAEVSNARKATAIKLLSSRGVEPGTLTREQFCTFSNQAPALQKESLELLAHYGAERLAIVPAADSASNPNSNTNTQSPTPAPAPAPAAATPVVVTPVPAPVVPQAAAATKQPAKRRQSKAASASASETPILFPDYTPNSVQDSLPGLRGGEAPAPRRRSKANSASSQISPVPLPATAHPGQEASNASAAHEAPAVPVSAIVEKPAKAPRKPRAARPRKSAATVPADEDDSPVLPAAGLAHNTGPAAVPDTSVAAFNTSSQGQQAATNHYGVYTQPQQQQQQQQQQHSHRASASSGQRNQAAAKLPSPPTVAAQQAMPSLASYQTSNQQHGSTVSYNQQSAVGSTSTSASSAGNYNQYNNYGRTTSTSAKPASTGPVPVTMAAQVPSTATAQPLFDTFLNDYQHRTSPASFSSGNASTSSATNMAAVTSTTANQWPSTSVDNSYMANNTTQQQRQRSQTQQPQPQQQPSRTTTPMGYGGHSRPNDASYAQLMQQQQQQQQSTSRVTQHRQQETRTQSPVAAYGRQASRPPASSGYGQMTSSSAAPAAPMQHLGSGLGSSADYQRQQLQQQHNLHGQTQQQHHTQTYQQRPQQHQHLQHQQHQQHQHQQHQPHTQQHQNQQQHQRADMRLGNGRNAYGNQMMTDDMYDMLRRQQGQ